MNPTDYPFSSQSTGDQTPEQRDRPHNPYALEAHIPPQPLAQFGVGGSPAISSRSTHGDMITGGHGTIGPDRPPGDYSAPDQHIGTGPNTTRRIGPPTSGIVPTTGGSLRSAASPAGAVGLTEGRRLEGVYQAEGTSV
ncbi:hypothetical protein BX666DRAFT_1879671 [Dichotomocladium elegans]|nr:hypothetical protein BX666DRAFT_1879671 [Dichotomocladium elegans]